MAFTTADTTHSPSLSETLRHPLASFWSLLIRIGEASPAARQLDAISKLTDEELTALNTTRMEQTRKVLGPRYYL